jgi:low affinity Fe/Cu permease
LHIIDRLAARPVVAVAAVVADLAWMAYSASLGFPTKMDAIFQTLAGAVTLAMVFVIQHTQARQQVATQRKLDEILRALPEAENSLIALEEASESTLAQTRKAHRTLRREAVHTRGTAVASPPRRSRPRP